MSVVASQGEVLPDSTAWYGILLVVF